jgi:hypothetical protein
MRQVPVTDANAVPARPGPGRRPTGGECDGLQAEPVVRAGAYEGRQPVDLLDRTNPRCPKGDGRALQ